MTKISVRACLSVVVIGGFFVAYFMDPSNETFRGALVGMTTAAVQYWLGSSRGAEENREALNRSHDKLLENK